VTLATRLGPVGVARVLVTAALGLLVLVLLLLIIGFLLNSFDARLSAEAAFELTAPPNPFPPADNIYVALVGLDGPSHESVIDIGQARIATYNQRLESLLREPGAVPSGKRLDLTLAFDGDLSAWQPLTTSIWTNVKSHRDDIAHLLAKNQVLYSRYLELHRLKGYYQAAQPSYLMPHAYVPTPLRTLFLADVANRLQVGSLEVQRAALSDLAEDMRMWKLVLRGNGDISAKMTATAALHGDFLLAADMIADPNSKLDAMEEPLGAALRELEPADWKIGNTFGTELRMRATHFMALRPFEIVPSVNGTAASGNPQQPSWWRRTWNACLLHFFKANAATNLSAAQMARLANLADSDPADFSRTLKAYRDWLDRNEGLVSPLALYNPVGKSLVRTAGATWEDYPQRAYDVAAFQRLVYLSLQLRTQRIGTADIAGFLTEHPEWSTHPIGNLPFRWSPATGELAVVTVATQPRGRRFSVKVGQPINRSN
jgi:hypothetical protein